MTYDFWSPYFIPELDVVAASNEIDRDWECYWDCIAPLACDIPPTPSQTEDAIACVVGCDPNPAVEFEDSSQCAHIPYAAELDAPEFTIEMWVRIDRRSVHTGQSLGVRSGR